MLRIISIKNEYLFVIVVYYKRSDITCVNGGYFLVLLLSSDKLENIEVVE